MMKEEVLNKSEELAYLDINITEVLSDMTGMMITIKEDGTLIGDCEELSQHQWGLIKGYLKW